MTITSDLQPSHLRPTPAHIELHVRCMQEVQTRDSTNPSDFALVCLLGLLGLRVFEAYGLSIADIGEEHG
jgi:hypothetical protein